MKNRILFVAAALVALSGCNGDATDESGPGASLEQAAIDNGVIADPDALDLAGRYGGVSGSAKDRFCAVHRDGGGYRVGLLAAFGANTQCEGQGAAQLDGENVRLFLTGGASNLSHREPTDDCIIEARFDGDVLQLSGRVPEGCAAYCSSRASLAGAAFVREADGDEAAHAARGRAIERLCPDLPDEDMAR